MSSSFKEVGKKKKGAKITLPSLYFSECTGKPCKEWGEPGSSQAESHGKPSLGAALGRQGERGTASREPAGHWGQQVPKESGELTCSLSARGVENPTDSS